MKFKFNVPNNITVIRVTLIPLFAGILLLNIPHKKLLAAFIFGMLSISDFLDGYFARRKRQVTEFGKLIDPVADKLLISTALIFLIGQGVDLWMAIAIISREVIITAVRIYLAPSRIVVPSSSFGKAKTVVQSISIIFVLLELPLYRYVMLAAVLITILSGLEYIIRIKIMTGNKIINLPNLLTLFRILLIIPFVYYFVNSKANIALLVFSIITLTDKLDGISARLMNQKTELGSALDSFTDWALIIITFTLLLIKKYISSLWYMLLVIPAAISGAMKLVYAVRSKIMPVTMIARFSVGMMYITIILILTNIHYKIKFGFEVYILIVTIITIYIAMFVYVFKALSLPKTSASKDKKTAKFLS